MKFHTSGFVFKDRGGYLVTARIGMSSHLFRLVTQSHSTDVALMPPRLFLGLMMNMRKYA